MPRRNVKRVNCEICEEEFSHEEGHVPKLISCGHTFCETCLKKMEFKITVNSTRSSVNNGTRTTMRGLVAHDPPWQTMEFDLNPRGRIPVRTISSSGNWQFGHPFGQPIGQPLGKPTIATERYEITCPKCKAKTTSDNSCTSLPKNYAYLDLINEVLEEERNQPHFCEHHPDYVIDRFCHHDHKAVCLNCAVDGDHKGHTISRLMEYSEKQKDAISFSIGCLEKKIKDWKNLQSELEVRKDELANKVEYMRRSIMSKFSFIQSEIKRILDAKLETILNQVLHHSAIQTSLLEENMSHSLDTTELEEIRDQANDFLSKADKRKIAEEKDLLKDVQACLEKVESHKLYSKHVYEVEIDSADVILQKVRDLVSSWICSVEETVQASCESVATVTDKYSAHLEESAGVLFDEKQGNDAEIGKNLFEGIDCEISIRRETNCFENPFLDNQIGTESSNSAEDCFSLEEREF